MPRITGPYITKTIHVPAHDEQVFDEDAYWVLGFDGEPDPEEGTDYFAKVAYPTLRDAQMQQKMMALAWEAKGEAMRLRTRELNRQRRAERKQRRVGNPNTGGH